MIFNELKRKVIPKVSFLVNQSYLFKQLNPTNRKDAIQLLAAEFQTQEPLTNAYYKLYPQEKLSELQNWKKFWEMFSEDFTTNELSVGCFDREKDKLVGVCVANDISFTPEGFQEKYMKHINFISPVLHLEKELMRKIIPKYSYLLLPKNKVIYMWGIALNREHMGKQLLHKMILTNAYFGALKQYSCVIAFASNFKTAVALQKLNFEKISQVDPSSLSLNGVEYFKQIEGIHRCSSLWMRKIRSEENKKQQSQ